jgi:3-polyprenyl-4-hydroxybenzoate decarboxylase
MSYPLTQQVLEHTSVKTYLDENETILVDATSRFYHLPEVLEDYIHKNIGMFIDEKTLDVNQACDNIRNFVAETVFVFLDQISTDIVEEQYVPIQ